VCYFWEMKYCKVCVHPARSAIENAVLSGGVSLRRIAAEIGGTSAWAIRRHRAHLPKELVRGERAEEVAAADSLLARLELLIGRFHGIATMAESRKDWTPAVQALREVRQALELLARLRGELDAARIKVQVLNQQVNIGISNDDPDTEIALLISKVTNGFSAMELERYRALAEAHEPELEG
jgi:DNA-binding FrmR family transcriptional regulator